MSELNPAAWLQNAGATHAANVMRLYQLLLSGGAEGVLPSYGAGTLLVTQRGAGANMSVDVAAGVAAVMGDESSMQGLYGVANQATRNVTVAAADPTNPRRDLIVCRVRDAFYSGAANAWDLFVVQGTPAASPADPVVPVNAMCLARVTVPAAAASIVNANIADLRAWTPLGWLVVNSARRPGVLYGPFSQEPSFRPVPVNGQPVFETDTGRVLVHDGAAWQRASNVLAAGRTGGRWRRAANQAILNVTNTEILWDAEDADSDGFLTPTSATFTIPTGLGGMYLISVEMVAQTGATVGASVIRLMSSPGLVLLAAAPQGATNAVVGESPAATTFFRQCNAGDAFRIQYIHNGGVTMNFTGRLNIHRVNI